MDNLFFLEVKCSKSKNNFYARFDYAADNVWVLTYGVKDLPAGEKVSSGNSQQDISNMRIGPQYKCPYCQSKSFVKCGVCGNLTCYDESGHFDCVHCSNSGTVSGYIDKVDVSNSGRGQ